ncbi:unnamed protein product [Parascedosporium putredinis]|uniref:FAD-binding domain-containing protein n=1 Tax=Parascedosporium putredinis TaxID=1442378 RepID=A0A9P1GZ44_9PEZI|nr:unnamed protein product [Parascedosporium putredinis]CAI7992460.1 unnamed protein product [Parascedosporium putredinis]
MFPLQGNPEEAVLRIPTFSTLGIRTMRQGYGAKDATLGQESPVLLLCNARRQPIINATSKASKGQETDSCPAQESWLSTVMRVIIIGAGPAGLALGHALTQAGIDDFVILERRQKVVEATGAGLGLWPHAVRILDQLGNGLFEAAEKIVPKMKKSVRLGNEGGLVLATDLFAHVEENHGYAFWMFERMRLLELLYTHLPRVEERVLTGKTVTSLSQTDSTVTVECDDGSKARQGLHLDLPRHVWLRTSTPGLVPGEMTERNKDTISSQLLTTKDSVVWFLYERLDKTTTKRARYTAEDQEALAERCKDFSVVADDSIRFGDLWASKSRAGLADLEEGMAERWSSGRAVLVGDAAHKMASNLALGANTAMESVVCLANKLWALDRKGAAPDGKAVETAFAAYQKERQASARYVTRLSGMLLRYSWLLARTLSFVGRFASLENDRMVADKILAGIPRAGLALDFAAAGHPKKGNIPLITPLMGERGVIEVEE